MITSHNISLWYIKLINQFSFSCKNSFILMYMCFMLYKTK